MINFPFSDHFLDYSTFQSNADEQKLVTKSIFSEHLSKISEKRVSVTPHHKGFVHLKHLTPFVNQETLGWQGLQQATIICQMMQVNGEQSKAYKKKGENKLI